MAKPTSSAFLLKSIVVGLLAALVVLVLRPDLLGGAPTSLVELHEAPPVNVTLPAGAGPYSYAEAVTVAAPSVVNVYTAKVITERPNPLYDDPFFRRFFGEQLAPRQHLETSLGSGVIISPQGYVLTNNHVIEGAAEVQVGLQDGRSAEAKVVGADPETDLAVLKIELGELPAITISQSDSIHVGDVVLAIGNPFGVGQTVTMGIVSATGRNRVGISTFENFIQTDAAINPGNSGGALINPLGHLVGINTAIVSRSGGSQGIGFAIPVSTAKDIMQQIIEFGHVVRGWLGVEAQDIDPRLAESFNLGDTKGVIVAGVLRGGPAEHMDLRPGDVITHVDGVAVSDSRTVMDKIARVKPDQDITLSIWRHGETLKLTGKVGERPMPRLSE